MSLLQAPPPPSPVAFTRPAAASPQRWRRMVDPAASISALALATVALHVRDPHASGSWGFCPSALLGIWCPGCGSLRAVNDLTDFRFADALSSNLVLVIAMPVLVFLLARWAVDRWTGHVRPRIGHQQRLLLGWVVLPLLAAFMVLRNLPVAPGIWLAP